MKKFIWIGVAVFLLILLVFVGFGTKLDYRLKRKNLNVILITIDTLRADHLGCYGYKKVETPNLDNLCNTGIKFEDCVSQVPLTLPSHTTILSGTYPFYHGVRDNGGFVVPEEVDTIAEILKRHGFSTGAVVGAYVLDGKWGLNQGFDFYYDNFDLSKYKRISLSFVERRAGEVIKHAMDWLKKNKNKRFFLWVHVYDPHSPYRPPSPFDIRYADHPYDGEIAYTDSQLGKFFGFLKKSGLSRKTLLVVTADHGESLGEHGEQTHGFFVYEATVRVPLIIKAPIKGLSGKVSHSRVGLVDIAPTILDFLGYPLPPQMQGKSLKKLLFNPDKKFRQILYTESFYPKLHFGWHDLKAIYWKNYKYIQTRKPELYDLNNDPNEKDNLYFKKNQIAKRLMRMLRDFEHRWKNETLKARFKVMDAETKSKLATLGYISTFVSSGKGKNPPDPKEEIGIFNEIIEARRLTKQGKFEEAIMILHSILNRQPDIVDAIFTLGNLYYRKKDYKASLNYFLKVLKLKPDYNFAMLNILNCYRFLGKIDKGIAEAKKFIKLFPKQSEFYIILANFYIDKGKLEEAKKNLGKAWEVGKNPVAKRDLGIIYLMENKLAKARQMLQESVRLNSSLRLAHYNLALLEEKQGNIPLAISEYEKELKINPENVRAHFNIARLYRESGEKELEISHLEKAVEIAPDFQIGLLYLAKAYLDEGKYLDKAINLAKKGIKLNPNNKYAVFGYYILSDIYSLMGDQSKSDYYYRKGLGLKSKLNKS